MIEKSRNAFDELTYKTTIMLLRCQDELKATRAKLRTSHKRRKSLGQTLETLDFLIALVERHAAYVHALYDYETILRRRASGKSNTNQYRRSRSDLLAESKRASKFILLTDLRIRLAVNTSAQEKKRQLMLWNLEDSISSIQSRSRQSLMLEFADEEPSSMMEMMKQNSDQYYIENLKEMRSISRFVASFCRSSTMAFK